MYLFDKRRKVSSRCRLCLLNSLFLEIKTKMTQSNKRKQAKNTSHHGSNSGHEVKKSCPMRIFMMYFVIFGTILAFVGLIGDDDLPNSGMFLLMLVFLTFIISTIATISHVRSGKISKIDEMSEKW